MSRFLYALARRSFRHRRAVLAAWAFAAVLIAGLGLTIGGSTTDSLAIPGTDSQAAIDLLEERFPEQGGSTARIVYAAPDGGSLTDPARALALEAVTAEVAAQRSVIDVSDPASAMSADGRIAFSEVRYPSEASEVEEPDIEAVHEALDTGLAGTDVTSEVAGDVITASAEAEGHTSELIGLAVAVVVLLISFGSLVAAGLPLLTALLGVGIAISTISLASALIDLSSTAPTLAIMIGLAVGIDYALFIVSRHRQNLAEGLPADEAAARATATAGSAVVFAGLTVVIALAGLAVVGIPFLTAMGIAASSGVVLAVIIAITLLPALLGFAGDSMDRWRLPGLRRRGQDRDTDAQATFGSRWAAKVTSRPVAWLAVGVAVMAVLAVPFSSMRLGLPDDGSLPTDRSERRAYDLLAEGFGSGFNGPLSVVIDDPTDGQVAFDAVAERLGADDGVAMVAPAVTNQAGDTAVVTVFPTGGPSSADTEDLIDHIRDDIAPALEADTGARVLVTGSTAVNIDMAERMSSALPTFMILVIGLTLVLLLLAFRSVLIPIKAALAILLSIVSSFGVVVAMFQWGWLKDLIGLEETVPIVGFLPIIMFAILFGLSMDYEVFILSRIREEWTRTGDPRASILTGLSTSARVITAAALIMISVFGSFVLGDDPIIKMFGIGLSVAVLLDATIVRMIIVPAVMTLLDRRAWWLPGWLDRRLPDLDLEGDELLAQLQAEHDEDERAESVGQVPVPTGT